jgi:predicted RNA binding protein YcfA (HicA-like mRNA interferase family)
VADPVLLRVLRGSSDANIRFSDLCALLSRLGFAERINGSHHIFTREGVADILNLQAAEFICETLSGQTSTENPCSA